MHTLNKLSACILTGTLILSGMTSTVKADENRINTDHNTYYIGNVEYNEDGTIVDASHVCNMQVETPPTTDGNDTDVNPDPEPSEPTEPVTPAPTPEPQPPKEDGGTTDKPDTTEKSDKPETSTGTITIIPNENEGDKKADISTNQTVSVSTGYISSVKNALKYESLLTKDWSKFILAGNPFAMPQCTYYAWSRFYQVYGFSSGAFGNGKDNAREIVAAHPDKFTLSNMPSGGAVFSAQANTLYPEFGHVGFVEAFDGTNLWISEGNYTLSNGDYGYIHIYRTTFQAFKSMYPDVVFAVPNGSVLENSLLSNVSLYSTRNGLNVTNTSVDNTDNEKVKKLQYKDTKRKNTIYYENGEKIQQFKFKADDEEIKAVDI